MADFDAIYEDIQDEEPVPPLVPKSEPILIRGTGNMTVYVFFFVYCIERNEADTFFLC